MPELDKQQILADFMDGQLSAKQRQQFETLCIEDQEFAEQVELFNRVTAVANDHLSQRVPDWHRESTFVAQKLKKWWQWEALPAVSMAFSALAIVMVVSGFQIKVEQGAMTFSFNRATDTAEVEQLVQQRLEDFKNSQQQALASYAQSLQQQQLDASTQLTNYLLASSRKERREDFGEFIKFINQQRSDDQDFYARQLNKLQQDIYTNPGAQWDGVESENLENQ